MSRTSAARASSERHGRRAVIPPPGPARSASRTENARVPVTGRIAISPKSAARMSSRKSSASPSANGARMVRAASLLTCRASMSANASNPGLYSMLRHTISPRRPPGPGTRYISRRSAARRSEEKLQPELTVHDVEAATVRERHRHGTGFPPCYGRAGGRLAATLGAATASMPRFRSRPTIMPVRPTRCEASRATTPVPQATSRTRSPGRGSAIRHHPGAQRGR